MRTPVRIGITGAICAVVVGLASASASSAATMVCNRGARIAVPDGTLCLVRYTPGLATEALRSINDSISIYPERDTLRFTPTVSLACRTIRRPDITRENPEWVRCSRTYRWVHTHPPDPDADPDAPPVAEVPPHSGTCAIGADIRYLRSIYASDRFIRRGRSYTWWFRITESWGWANPGSPASRCTSLDLHNRA